jgi:hypothetical protein
VGKRAGLERPGNFSPRDAPSFTLHPIFLNFMGQKSVATGQETPAALQGPTGLLRPSESETTVPRLLHGTPQATRSAQCSASRARPGFNLKLPLGCAASPRRGQHGVICQAGLGPGRPTAALAAEAGGWASPRPASQGGG